MELERLHEYKFCVPQEMRWTGQLELFKGGLYLRRGSQIFMKFFSWLQDIILRWQGGFVPAFSFRQFSEKSAKVEK